jgi:signal transduction histidine kinase
VRQLTHDVRNVLNNIDLQTAFLQGIITDSEATPELKRLRAMVSESAKMLQALSARFWLNKPNFVTYAATIFFEDFQTRLAKLFPEQASDIHWKVKLGEEAISVDIEMLFRGLIEYFQNAIQFREEPHPIEARVGIEKGRLIIEIIEVKSSVSSPPETWGHEPLVSTRRGGFGMGLFHARQVLAVHEGTVVTTFDPAEKRLTTRVSLPLAAH